MSQYYSILASILCFSGTEVANIFSELKHPTYRLMANLLCKCGLRLLECIRLRIFDVDFVHHQIIVRNTKLELRLPRVLQVILPLILD